MNLQLFSPAILYNFIYMASVTILILIRNPEEDLAHTGEEGVEGEKQVKSRQIQSAV